MIQISLLAPLAIGGLIAFWHERRRHRHPFARKLTLDRSRIKAMYRSTQTTLMEDGDLVQMRRARYAAYGALGLSSLGVLYYPALGAASILVLGYGAFSWLQFRVRSKPYWRKSPTTLLTMLALGGSLVTGSWLLSSLVLSIDLSAREWILKRRNSTLSRRSNGLRITLLLLTNLAILLILSVILSVLGVATSSLLSLLLLALAFGLSGSFISLAMSKWIAKRMTGAQVIEQPSNEVERWLIDTLSRQAKQAGIGMPEVAIYQSPDVNAFATGMKRNNALIAVSTGLIARMTDDEVEAVLGHELAHVANGDMVTLGLIQGVLNSFVFFISRLIAGGIDALMRNDKGSGGLGFFGYMAVTLVLELTLGLLAMFIVMWFSRQREYRADEGGAELAGSEKMIAALERLRTVNVPSQLPEQLAAFGIQSAANRFAKLLSSHPSLEDRIAALRDRLLAENASGDDVEDAWLVVESDGWRVRSQE